MNRPFYPRCVQCARLIRNRDKAEFLFLRPDHRTEDGVVEVWIHRKKCLDIYNGKESDDHARNT